MTANILTPGHIRCLDYLSNLGDVVVGLLTSNALIGYKKEVVPFEDRKEVLEAAARGVSKNIQVIAQSTLDPAFYIQVYGCTALASGDGFEPQEEEAAKSLGIKLIDIKLDGETVKSYSSSKILNEDI